MAAAYTDWLHWLEKTVWATTIRKSLWLYPSLEIVHISGIALLVGAAFLFDLRLLGFSRNLPVTALAAHLLTWSRRGLWLIIPSGILLFSTNAVALGQDRMFWLKMALLILAGLNAAAFHAVTFRSVTTWNKYDRAPARARVAAICSIMLWLAIIACGRLLAY